MLKTMHTIIETNANKVLSAQKGSQTCHAKSKTKNVKYKHAVGVKSGRQP